MAHPLACERGPGGEPHRLHTHRHHLLDQADDVRWIVVAVGIVGNAAAFVGADLILVDNPVEG